MRINLFGLHIHIGKATSDALKAFGAGELDKAVLAAKQTELGAAVVGIVKAVDDPAKTGPEKLAAAVALAAPVVLDYATRGGFAGVLADVETFSRQLIESTLADTRRTSAVQVALALLGLFGVKV